MDFWSQEMNNPMNTSSGGNIQEPPGLSLPVVLCGPEEPLPHANSSADVDALLQVDDL